MARPEAAAAYAEARARLVGLLEGLAPPRLSTRVPACPDWSVHDVLAHLTGVAVDAVAGRYYRGSTDAWRDPRLARERDAWTAAQVAARRGRPVRELAAEWAEAAAVLEPMLAGEAELPAGSPAWLRAAPLADLAVHLQDVRGALALPGDRDAAATWFGLRAYARWLGQRLDERGRPALRLRAGEREWVEGSGAPAAALAGDPFELFRALSGRRSRGQVEALAWEGSAEPYLDLFAPYPMPAAPLLE